MRHGERARFVVLNAAARVRAADVLIGGSQADLTGQVQDASCCTSVGQRERQCDVVTSLDCAGRIHVERIGAVGVFAAACDTSQSNLERIVEGIAGRDPFERPGGQGIVVEHHWHTRFGDGEVVLNSRCGGVVGVAGLICRDRAFSDGDWVDLAIGEGAGCCRERTEADRKPARACGGKCNCWIAYRFVGQCGEVMVWAAGCVVVAVGQATSVAKTTAAQVRPNQWV
jgi:hypothetical protein